MFELTCPNHFFSSGAETKSRARRNDALFPLVTRTDMHIRETLAAATRRRIKRQRRLGISQRQILRPRHKRSRSDAFRTNEFATTPCTAYRDAPADHDALVPRSPRTQPLAKKTRETPVLIRCVEDSSHTEATRDVLFEPLVHSDATCLTLSAGILDAVGLPPTPFVDDDIDSLAAALWSNEQ